MGLKLFHALKSEYVSFGRQCLVKQMTDMKLGSPIHLAKRSSLCPVYGTKDGITSGNSFCIFKKPALHYLCFYDKLLKMKIFYLW